jgi:pimeloyl-ACP methyl ester carboxylesterase
VQRTSKGSETPKPQVWAVLATILVAIVVVLIANTFIVGRETRAAAPRDGGQLVDTDVVQANVKVEGRGPPIVMIHGFSAALDWWDAIAPELAKDHSVIRLDLIGHGGTAAPASGYSIQRQAALVAAVLDKLGATKVTVIGHSMGGEVADALAIARPELVDRMILIDSPPKNTVEFSATTEAYLTPVVGEVLSHLMTDEAIRKGLAQGFAPGFPVPDRFIADVRQLTYTAFRSAHDDSVAYQVQKPAYQRLAALNPPPPLLVVFGADDRLVPADTAKLFEKVPGARVVWIDGAGHSPMVEQPARTLELIKSFLPAEH